MLNSLTSEIMPVTISSPHKQIYSFCIVLAIHITLLGAFKIWLFKISSPTATRKRINSKKFPKFILVNSNNELLENCGSSLRRHKESAWRPQKIIVSIIDFKTID